MRTIKQKIFAALAALLFATLMLSAVFLIPKSKDNAYANNASTLLEELTVSDYTLRSDGNLFSYEKMQKLYSKLTGGSNSTYNDVKSMLDAKGEVDKYRPAKTFTAADLISKGGGEYNVMLGGKRWTPTYLSYDNNGNIILTLWLSSGEGSVKFNNWSANATTTVKYPSSAYSTSYIRAYLVGTPYVATQTATTLTDCTFQSPEWKSFSGIFDDFLVAPNQVEWQLTQSLRTDAISKTSQYPNGFTHDIPNDACGTPKPTENWYVKGVVDMTKFKSITDNNGELIYNDWGNDKIWLPSTTETGTVPLWSGKWRCTDNQIKNGSDYWQRSSSYCNADMAVPINAAGAHRGETVSKAYTVRPAIHLNLTAADESAVTLLDEPSNVTVDYTANKQTIESAAALGLAEWYDETLYEGIDISYAPAEAINAQQYNVTMKITGEHLAWKNGATAVDKTRTITMTVNPAKITIQSSKQSELTKGYDYVYHTGGEGTHALKFPAANEADYIDLNAVDSGGSDKASLKIFYYIQTHDEKDHQNFVENTLPEIEKTLETLPDLSDGGDAKTGWVKYAADNASLNVNDVQGYCVFYKVTADNHKTLYGHFSVHIATEELKIYTDGNPLTESPVEFGSPDVPHKQEDLKKLAEAIITGVQDQNGEPRLDSLDKTKFVFYLKNRDTGDEVHTIEDSGGEARWNAGTYELWVKYVDEGKSQFINFTWNSARPTLTIKPQEITLTWKGNDNWETDSAGASETVRDMDEFSWVYDGSSHNPTASFVDKYKETIKPAVTITGEYINAQSYTATAPDVANYTFTNKTQTFKIVKAKNGWKDGKGYDRGDWSVGGKIAQEYVPEDLFGNTAKVYYYKAYSEEDGFSQQYTGDFSDIKEPTVFYVQILIEPDNDNYDGIEEMKSFQITVCTRHEAKAGEYGHNEQGHWTICKFCGEQIESEPQPHAAEDGAGYSSDGSQHWQTCKTCGVEFGRENHIAKEGDGALGHDSSQHWNICQTCNKDYDKVAHSYTIEGNITKYPNCTESGTKQYKCVCGEIEERDIDPTGHTAKAGWQSDGSRHWQVCSTCSEIIEESRKNHSWAYTPQVDPKCTAPGHTEFWKCSDCEKLREDCKDEDIDPIPHTFGAEKERREPTCTQPGSETGMCTMCQNRVTNILPATGHSYAEKIERAATCTLAGSKIEECTACHEMKPDSRVSIPMTEHTYGTWNTLLAATCEDSGTDQHACTACGHKEERTVQPLGHSMQRHAQKDATETAAGNIEYYECSKCHKYYDSPTGGIPLSATDIVIPALGSGNMSTGGGGDDGFFKNNWWWIMLIALAILIILLIVWIISSSRARRRERERDRQFEALLKMQMMHYGFGMGGYQNAAENDAAFTEKQQPAQLPYTQEMIDVAVAAAMSAMQRMNASKPDGGNPPHDDNNGGGESANDGGGNGGSGGGDDDGFVDDFGFYDEYKP